MIFLQKIISQSPESGSPQVSLNSNFLGRVTTITWNYCLLSPGMCYKNIIQKSFSEYTIGLLVGGGPSHLALIQRYLIIQRTH